MTDDLQAIFVRGGTILHLLIHNNGLALSRVQYNPIALEVYIDEEVA